MLSLQHVSKAYGPTKATRDVSVEIPSGEIVGLLGANGAGKSTLIKILSGIVRPDEGAIQFEGNEVAGPHWGPSAARNAGIRVVHQELSLCTNLTVYENFFLESPQLGSNPLLLAKRYVPMAKEALDKIFPGHGIDCRSSVQKLTIAERQMVEIARAASDPNLRLLILDEPSSSLDRDRSAQLSAYLQSLAQQGILSFYISHKLAEVVALVTHVLVLRNGELVWNGPASEITTQSIIAHMGGKDSVTAPSTPSKVGAARDRAVLLTIGRDDPLNATGSEITFRDSEVIGFAGLEGNGQREALWRVKKMHGKASYVSGDRRTDGVFPISSVLDNATISATAVRGMFRTVSRSQDESAVLEYFDRLRLPRDRADNNILTLSGGNQQKALMVRALATGNPVTLLDDPTRGVDIGVKQEFYAIIRQSADQGCRLIIWNSSEDTEFAMCDRVCVFSGGRIQKVISGADATKSELVAAAFESNSGQQAAGLHGKDRSYLLSYLAPASMMALLVWAASLNPNIASYNGIDLVLGGAIPLVLAALAQMFMVGGSQIDLGVGNFVSLASVLVAVYFAEMPLCGAIGMLLLILSYGLTAFVVELGRVPSIIATLGLSFIWLGIGYVVQDTPGGMSPDWLTNLVGWQPPLVPVSVIILVAAAAGAYVINMSGLGVVMRGFGNNPHAMKDVGWSPPRYQFYRFLVAACFAAIGGLFLTGIYTASDINAGAPLTLLSVAALVMGGCSLTGGIISPVGTVCGAITLTLVAMLLGQLRLPPDYTPMVQGGMLLLVLFIRSIATGGKRA